MKRPGNVIALILGFVTATAIAADCKDGEWKQIGDQGYRCDSKRQAWVPASQSAGVWISGSNSQVVCQKEDQVVYTQDETAYICHNSHLSFLAPAPSAGQPCWGESTKPTKHGLICRDGTFVYGNRKR